ncbi:MAG TPA: hypothetical protein VHB77_04560 [Planctomycetaceae bacterium]|nr:hypothetical protein [Planctomycetaceae bacterium]
MTAQPDWLNTFANAISKFIEPADETAPLGCHIHDSDGLWEVTLFVGSTEVVGGERDGAVRRSRFTVDLAKVCELFTAIVRLDWQALSLGARDELGAHVSIEGVYAGEKVWLRILASPPKGFPPARQALIYDRTWKELW